MCLSKARVLVALPLLSLAITPLLCQTIDPESLVRRIDNGAESRYQNVLAFTVTERYAVYRGSAESEPAAEMIVRTTYHKDEGKTYTIVSQSGSPLILRFGLHALLASEQSLNKPGNIERYWFTSANYDMTPDPAHTRRLDGHDCIAVKVSPHHKAPSLIDGILWVDAKDGSLIQMEGLASRKPSVWAGPTHMKRQYRIVNGYAMAAASRAESDSPFFGHTVVTIDCSDYRLQLRADSSGQ